MTTPTPLAGKTDLVTYTISLNGDKMPDTYKLSSLTVHKEVNRIAHATVVLFDGDPSDATFEISETAHAAPGAEMVVAAGYHGHEATLFKGIVVKHGVRVQGGKSYLTLSCYDKAVKLTQGRKSAYLGKTDSDIMKNLIGAAGLSAKVEGSTAVHDLMVRYYSTDWDFIVSRAEANGRIVLVDDGQVQVCAPACDGKPVLHVGYGDALKSIDAEMDARHQYSSVECTAWDFSTQSVVTASSSEPSVNNQGNLDGKTLAAVLGRPAFSLQSPTPLPNAELKVWADAQLLKSRLARLRGKVGFRGNALPKPGGMITLAGLGERFNGDAFIASVNHHIESGDWTTEVGFGLAPGWFVEQTPDVNGPLAAGLMPGIQGLHNGVVRKIDEDPDGQTRVQVDVPTIGVEGEGIWARLASGYATEEAGIFFVPEIGDEVVLGFLNNHPGFPIVLGSLYSGKRTPPYAADAPNTYKAIVTKAKLKITMNDVEKSVQIETPGGHKLTMTDEGKTVTLLDSNKNKLHFSSSGIVLDSPGDITIKAGGQVSISAATSMSAKAGTDMDAKAPNVSVKADLGLTLQGQGTAEFSSSGQATVRGAMVMIN
jgi:Rhs element Vgr protein